MKTLITLCSLVAALCLAWQRHDLNEAKEAAESKASDITSQLENTRAALQAAQARIADLSRPVAAPKTNWVEERNRNWQSSLSNGASDNRRVTTPPIVYPTTGQQTYYTDLKGRYWVDSSGIKHYVN